MIAFLPSLLPNFRVADAVDVAIVAVLLYVVFLALKQTRTTFLVIGMTVVAVLYVVAISLELRLTRYLFQLVVAVSLIGLIVVFHEELRTAVERFLSWRVRWRRSTGPEDPAAARVIETIIAAVTDFARERVGALIVIAGRQNPSRHIRGGSQLDGVLSEALLKSIFDPHSMGHDGAVLVVGERIERFACHLPLSTDSARIGKLGTRHAAALGISEKTDSLCLVVSEERGTISISRNGELTQIEDLAQLNGVLGDFFKEISPARPRPAWGDALRKHPFLKLAAIVVALILWYLVVHESSIEYRQFVVEPRPIGLREGLHATIVPVGRDGSTANGDNRLRVVVSGPRRSFYFKKDEHVQLDVKLFDRDPGTYEVFLMATDVTLPEGLTFVNIAPTRSVRVTVTN